MYHILVYFLWFPSLMCHLAYFHMAASCTPRMLYLHSSITAFREELPCTCTHAGPPCHFIISVWRRALSVPVENNMITPGCACQAKLMILYCSLIRWIFLLTFQVCNYVYTVLLKLYVLFSDHSIC